ncbi:DUF3592 domain-containing protein [Pontibacter sp. Tf4]|uniref:DUF3592 domain-containing protein n=1 Tax=Pontibacter sp. Tf4 TaxID=2761620 RepID=UPI00162398E5|nr:DUF3592 domain-containing protein [Pontibacter sp. Tf4]MBB6611097.1 DUF3592 domain-containing protein [Pontibacter sp. Tf4]
MDVFLLVFGLALFCVGVYWLITDYYQTKYRYHTTGKVIAVKGKWSVSSGKLTYLYFPTVQFSDQDGVILEQRLDIGGSIPLFYKGQSVKIAYHNGKIHPAGIGWKIFYAVVALAGFGVFSYQLLLIHDSGILQAIDRCWQIIQLIF